MDSFWKHLGFQNDHVAVSIDGKVLSMSNVDIVSAIDASTDFKALKSVRHYELKACSIKFGYKCTDLGCDLDSCFRDAKQSTDLKSTGIKDISVIVIDALKNNQGLFTVRQAGGFIFQAPGRGHVVIANETPLSLPAIDVDDRRMYGMINVIAARRRLIELHKREKENYATLQKGVVCGAGWTFLLNVLRIL